MMRATIDYLMAGNAQRAQQTHDFPTRAQAYRWIDEVCQSFRLSGARLIGYEVVKYDAKKGDHDIN